MIDSTEYRFDELAAGYVLGNLDSQEMAEFQQLATDHPCLWEKVAGLQSILDLLPFTLAESQPHPSVRAQIMEAATQTTVAPISLLLPQCSWTKIIGSMAAVTTVALGLHTVHLQRQLAQVQQELVQKQRLATTPLATPHPSAPNPVVITTTDRFVNHNWQGVEQILKDHHQSLGKGLQAVDIPSDQPLKLAALLKAKVPMPSAMPVLSSASSQLLGGSVCTFGQSQGVRITYNTHQYGQVSFYQIAQSQKLDLPQLMPEKLYLAIHNGPGGVFWSDGEFLYAMVSELSATDLKALTAALETVES